MTKSDVTYIVGSIFASATAVFYCCTRWFHITLPRYYPLQHTWKWVNEKGVPSQGWYGMQAFAYVAAGLLALAAWLILRNERFRQTTLTPRAIKTTAVATICIVLVCMGYMLYHEFSKWGIL
jgi:hypothetical protein